MNEVKKSKKGTSVRKYPEIGERLTKFYFTFKENQKGRQKVSQEKFADEMNVDLRQFQRYGNGYCAIPYDVLAKLHTQYELDLNWLICGSAANTSASTSERTIGNVANELEKLAWELRNMEMTS